MPRIILHLFCLFCFFTCSADLFLRDNLKFAKSGDFIVTKQGKTYTVMLIREKNDSLLTVEEISIPISRASKQLHWHSWIEQGAPNNTCWVRYVIDTNNGKMDQYYSFTLKRFCDLSHANAFLSTLLNLKFTKVPLYERKRRGNSPTSPDLWQPQMIAEGKQIQNVSFEPYKTLWPRDGSDLGGKEILVYLPQEHENYPSYFPYWLQISGMVEKAKIRIVDSGRDVASLH